MTRRLVMLTVGIVLVAAACTRTTTTQQALSSSELVGLSVVAPNGELVGTLKGLLLDPADGAITYGIVQLAPGPLEFGKMPLHAAPNRVLVPWRILSIATGGSHLLANCSLDRVRNAPPAPDRRQTDRQDWDAEFRAYWYEDTACSGSVAPSPQPTNSEPK